MSRRLISLAVLQIVTPRQFMQKAKSPHRRAGLEKIAKKIAIQEQIPETQFYLKSGPDV